MSAGGVQAQCSFGKRTGRFPRRRIDHVPAEALRCCRHYRRTGKQIRKPGWRDELSFQRLNLKVSADVARASLSQSRHFQQISRKNMALFGRAGTRTISELVQSRRHSLTLPEATNKTMPLHE
jgi:hypothetical protein